jgi:hypothetical protein
LLNVLFKKCAHRITDTEVHIVLHKQISQWWPRLTDNAMKRQWLKIDFDKWKDPDAPVSSEGEDDDMSGGKAMRKVCSSSKTMFTF